MIDEKEILEKLNEWKKDTEEEINELKAKAKVIKDELDQINSIKDNKKYNELVKELNKPLFRVEMLNRRLIGLNELIELENSLNL